MPLLDIRPLAPNVEAEKPRLGSVASRDVGLSQAGVSLTGLAPSLTSTTLYP
jgi:hypothetical protein